MAARHEQWVVELMDGLSSDEQRYMINELATLKAHIIYSGLGERKPSPRSQAGGCDDRSHQASWPSLSRTRVRETTKRNISNTS